MLQSIGLTMTKVGYGDITTKNDEELLINNLIMSIGSIVFAYSANIIRILVTNILKSQQTISLINKIYVYLQRKSEQNDDQVGDFFHQLNQQLQEELRFRCKIYDQYLFQFFNKRFILIYGRISCFTIIFQLKVFIYLIQNKLILFQILIQMISLIITKRSIKIYQNENLQKKTHKQFQRIAFLFRNINNYCNLSGFSRVLKIRRQVFLEYMKNYSDDQEKYQVKRKQILFGDQNSLLLQRFSCQSNTRIISDCKYIIQSNKKGQKEIPAYRSKLVQELISQSIKIRLKKYLYISN
ncbi:unnamed protein product [Paramecium sonneborni]|uniref:Potassium channel domain-containing protein n=1 Tax=Paramecium sonneborni TaxID=65129 RepID=A0A8S1RV09_9CILI|nr:unnamed protein product [Paramecium sonneborni]